MQRLKALITIKTKENTLTNQIEINYDKEKHYIYYLEQDLDKTAVIYDYKKNCLKRDNLKIEQEFIFKEKQTTKNKMILKELNSNLDIEIFTNRITSNEPSIEVSYTLNDEEYLYKIEIMEELQWVS